MTHETHKRWPPTAGVEADHITVDTRGAGAFAAERLRLHGIPHSTTYHRSPPTLEGWSFSVYNGDEEHASGWGSASLADMAPALLAAVGLTDAATANKRAQEAESERAALRHTLAAETDETLLAAAKRVVVDWCQGKRDILDLKKRLEAALHEGTMFFSRAIMAEQKVANLARDRDGAVEALDIANDMIGKLCVVMGGAGFSGDLLSGVQALIDSRTAALKERDSVTRELAAVVEALVPRVRHSDTPIDLARRTRGNLDNWERLVRENASARADVYQAQFTADLADRHFNLRLALADEIRGLREQLERVRSSRVTIAAENDAWCAWAAKLGGREGSNDHDANLRKLVEDKIADGTDATATQLRGRLTSAEGVLDSTRFALETPEGVSVIDHAAKVLKQSKQVAALSEQNEEGWAESRRADKVLAAVRAALETPDGESIVEHAAKVLKNSERADRMTEEVTRLNRALENTGGYGARERVKVLTWENKALRDQVVTISNELGDVSARAAGYSAEVARLSSRRDDARADADNLRVLLSKWQTWGRNKVGVNASVSDDNLRTSIDSSGKSADAISDLRKEVTMWKAGAAQTFAQLQEAHDAVNSAPALSDDCREALDYLIAHPGRGLTAELAHNGAKTLRQRLENGLPFAHPLRYLIDMALSAGVSVTHEMWDGEVQRTRGEAVALRKEVAALHAAADGWSGVVVNGKAIATPTMQAHSIKGDATVTWHVNLCASCEAVEALVKRGLDGSGFAVFYKGTPLPGVMVKAEYLRQAATADVRLVLQLVSQT